MLGFGGGRLRVILLRVSFGAMLVVDVGLGGRVSVSGAGLCDLPLELGRLAVGVFILVVSACVFCGLS